MSRVSEHWRVKAPAEVNSKIAKIIKFVKYQPGCSLLQVGCSSFDMDKAVNTGKVRREGRCPTRYYPVEG